MFLPRNGLKERILRCARFVELAKEYRSFAANGSELAREADRGSPIRPGGERRRLGKTVRIRGRRERRKNTAQARIAL